MQLKLCQALNAYAVEGQLERDLHLIIGIKEYNKVATSSWCKVLTNCLKSTAPNYHAGLCLMVCLMLYIVTAE